MWNELWLHHRGKCIGVGTGVFFGIIYLIWGLWDMLIFGFIVYLGYMVGRKIDREEPLFGLDDLWRWLTERWGMFR